MGSQVLRSESIFFFCRKKAAKPQPVTVLRGDGGAQRSEKNFMGNVDDLLFAYLYLRLF